MTVLAYVEGAVTTGTAPTVARVFSSPLGLAGTWVERTTLVENTSFFDSRIGAVYGVRAFLGQNGPVPIGDFAYEPLGVIAQTSNGATSWAGAVPTQATDFPGLTESQSAWLVREFLDYTLHAAGVVFAVCDYPTYNDYGSTVISLLKSTDSGVSFTVHVPTGVDDQFGAACGLVCASGRLLLCRQNVGAAATKVIYKSDDGGDTFTGVTTAACAGTAAAVHTLIQMAGGRLVAVGDRNVSGQRIPTVWYSDDDGDTWSVHNTPVDMTPYGTRSVTANAAVAAGSGALLSIMDGGGVVLAGHKPFRLSTDGLTYGALGTYSIDPIPQDENGTVRQMTVADDGAVLAIQAGAGTTEEGDLSFRIWRGVLNEDSTTIAWSSVFTASVPLNQIACQHSYIYNVGVLPGFVEVGQIEGCSTTFGPEPCPPECPPAPPHLDPEARAVAAAFRSALFLLGLGHAPPPGSATVLTGCAALTFVNESCARSAA